MENTKGKHMKKGRLHIKNESRFYSFLLIVLGIVSGFIFKAVGETDMTGPVFIVLFSLLGYISTFGEDG